jgi:xylitol oxidase
MGLTPSAGDEIHSEYLVARRHAVAAIEAVRALAGAVRPLLFRCAKSGRSPQTGSG